MSCKDSRCGEVDSFIMGLLLYAFEHQFSPLFTYLVIAPKANSYLWYPSAVTMVSVA